MKMKFITLLLALSWVSLPAFAKGKIQNEDIKSSAELIAAGGTAAQLPNDTKIWVTANALNKTLSAAITAGDFAGSGSALTTHAYTTSQTLAAFTVNSADCTSNSIVFTLPDATANSGKSIYIIRKDSSVTYTLTINAAGADTFNPTGITSLVLNEENMNVQLIPIGTIWYVFGNRL